MAKMGSRPDDTFGIRAPLKRKWRTVLMLIAPIAVLLIWCIFSYANVVSDDFLPSPDEVLKGTLQLFYDYDLGGSIWVSTKRILISFLLAASVAFPLGILMGAFTPI